MTARLERSLCFCKPKFFFLKMSERTLWILRNRYKKIFPFELSSLLMVKFLKIFLLFCFEMDSFEKENTINFTSRDFWPEINFFVRFCCFLWVHWIASRNIGAFFDSAFFFSSLCLSLDKHRTLLTLSRSPTFPHSYRMSFLSNSFLLPR